MEGIDIRPPDPADAEGLAQIWIENAEYYVSLDPHAFNLPDVEGLVDWVRDLLAESPSENELSLVAEHRGIVVGSLEARIVEPLETARWQMLRELGERRLVVNQLGVAREHWRRGIGTELMKIAESWGRDKGASLVCLDTNIHSPVSIGFYEGLGYDRRSINYRKRLD